MTWRWKLLRTAYNTILLCNTDGGNDIHATSCKSIKVCKCRCWPKGKGQQKWGRGNSRIADAVACIVAAS